MTGAEKDESTTGPRLAPEFHLLEGGRTSPCHVAGCGVVQAELAYTIVLDDIFGGRWDVYRFKASGHDYAWVVAVVVQEDFDDDGYPCAFTRAECWVAPTAVLDAPESHSWTDTVHAEEYLLRAACPVEYCPVPRSGEFRACSLREFERELLAAAAPHLERPLPVGLRLVLPLRVTQVSVAHERAYWDEENCLAEPHSVRIVVPAQACGRTASLLIQFDFEADRQLDLAEGGAIGSLLDRLECADVSRMWVLAPNARRAGRWIECAFRHGTVR